MNQITVPFTFAQVDALNQHQASVKGVLLSPLFTCPNRSEGVVYLDGQSDLSKATHGKEGGDLGILIATPAGWVCPYCGYTQDWAHGFMAEPFCAQPGPDRDSNSLIAVMMQRSGRDPHGELQVRVDQAIAEYSSLRLSRVININQSAEENQKSQRIWSACAAMLASLRIRRLALLGIVVRQGRPLEVDSTWHDLKLSKPADNVPVHLLLQDTVRNPGHDGFGCDAWIETCSFWSGSILFTGGKPTHWREMPPVGPMHLDKDVISRQAFSQQACKEVLPMPGNWPPS